MIEGFMVYDGEKPIMFFSNLTLNQVAAVAVDITDHLGKPVKLNILRVKISVSVIG
ncbi:MAG: hypothetical protein M0Q91_18740 [Methanoregula sp.]|jgi:hypothetical protein|nr:hypothetical protein [Methanoregula sp.]